MRNEQAGVDAFDLEAFTWQVPPTKVHSVGLKLQSRVEAVSFFC